MLKHKDVVFVAHDSSPVARQCLTILREFGCHTATLERGVLAPEGSWAFFPCSDLNPSFPSKFLRTTDEGIARSRISVPAELAPASRRIAINVSRLGRANVFAGTDLNGLTEALRQLCGYQPQQEKPKKLRRRRERSDLLL